MTETPSEKNEPRHSDFKRASQALRSRALMAGRIAWIRLRFFVIVGAIVCLVAQWDLLVGYLSKWTHAGARIDIAAQPVSGDTEYFCPMDPGVVSDWPSVCGVCHMTLVRRKRGDVGPLPDGVVSRMQISPYRLYLGGIQTESAKYEALDERIETVGRVTALGDVDNHARIALEVSDDDARGLLNQPAVRLKINDQETPLHRLAAPSQSSESRGVVIEVHDPLAQLRVSEIVRCELFLPVAESEPFRSLPSQPPPWTEGEPRAFYSCPSHPSVIEGAPGRCPSDDQPLHRLALRDDQRMRWWCPMHAEITADKPGSKCDACGGMTLVPRIIQYRPPGKVLAIPETAVVDTGRHQVVYVERMPGMFEGVQVSLGPRCGSAFPVFAGLEPGQRVVSQGAFLVDAEARLNPSVAVGYFGATPQAANAPRSAETPVVGEKDLAGPDQKLIVAQRICPVTGKPLGSMGAPVRVELSGRVLFVCCEACETPLRDQPMKYLKRLGETAFPDAKARNQGPP